MAVDTEKAPKIQTGLKGPMGQVAQAGKFLTFGLGREEYGLEILKVHEITGISGLSHLPDTPDFIRGVIMVRGREVPVLCLRRLFRMPTDQPLDKNCIIVVQVRDEIGEQTVGLLVDEVHEVLTLGPAQITMPPSCGGGMEATDFISGMGKLENRMVILIDMDRVLAGGELDSVRQTVAAPQRR